MKKCISCNKEEDNNQYLDKRGKTTKVCQRCRDNFKKRNDLIRNTAKEDERFCSSCKKPKPINEFKDDNITCIKCCNRRDQQLLDKLKQKVEEGNKICNKCGRQKSLDEFIGVKGEETKKCQYCRDIRNAQRRRRYEEDEVFKMTISLRCLLNHALKDNIKSESALTLLGCQIEELLDWLNFQLKIRYDTTLSDDSVYHLDHFKPCSSFNLNDDAQQKECFHWTNLQYLTEKDNLKKANHIPDEEDNKSRLSMIKLYKTIDTMYQLD